MRDQNRSVIAPVATRSPKAGSWKWWLMGVLFLATVLTYLDRQTLSLCAPMISDEFKLSNEQYGQLVAAFRGAYALTHIPAGWLADRFSVRAIYPLAVGLWSLAGAAGAFILSARQLFATRLALGIGEAFNWPCASRIVANTLPSNERGLGSGIFNSGAAIGSLLAPLIVTPIALRFGWRWAFFTIGAAGAFWIFLWMIFTRRGDVADSLSRNASRQENASLTSAASIPFADSGKSQPEAPRFYQLLARPSFWMLLIVAVTVNPCWYFLNEWIPKYMHDVRGIGFLGAGMMTIPIFIGADLGNLVSGGCIKLLTKRGWSLPRARGVTLGVAAFLILPAAFISRVQSPMVAVLLLGLAAFGITSIVANYTACMQDLSFMHVGIVAGINGMASNLCAALVNPYIGRYVDRTGNYTLILLLLALLPIVSVLAVMAFDSRNRTIQE
jgi:ACS family hexuronate transporter-like MFS transporter